ACAQAETRAAWSHGLDEFFVVHQVASWHVLRRMTSSLKPGVVVLDLAMPGLWSTESVAQIMRWSPRTRTLVLTEKESDEEGVSALRVGARGYCARTIEPALLRRAVAAIEKGEVWIRRRLLMAIVAALPATNDSRKAPVKVKVRRSRPFRGMTQRQNE